MGLHLDRLQCCRSISAGTHLVGPLGGVGAQKALGFETLKPARAHDHQVPQVVLHHGGNPGDHQLLNLLVHLLKAYGLLDQALHHLLVLRAPGPGGLCVHVAQGLPDLQDALLALADLLEEAVPRGLRQNEGHLDFQHHRRVLLKDGPNPGEVGRLVPVVQERHHPPDALQVLFEDLPEAPVPAAGALVVQQYAVLVVHEEAHVQKRGARDQLALVHPGAEGTAHQRHRVTPGPGQEVGALPPVPLVHYIHQGTARHTIAGAQQIPTNGLFPEEECILEVVEVGVLHPAPALCQIQKLLGQ
mmetsp:Transcript_44571/g.106095  ORF Transcript_44571/g.106095 Transcript_44571/m.106095 type:complete len:301 (-) Transcript_44571:948-1850(-)